MPALGLSEAPQVGMAHLNLSRWPRWNCCGLLGTLTVPLLPCVPVKAMCTSASVPAPLMSEVVM